MRGSEAGHTSPSARCDASGGHYMVVFPGLQGKRGPMHGAHRYSDRSWWRAVKTCFRTSDAATREPTAAPHAIMYITTI
jgi:hypothetical protein